MGDDGMMHSDHRPVFVDFKNLLLLGYFGGPTCMYLMIILVAGLSSQVTNPRQSLLSHSGKRPLPPLLVCRPAVPRLEGRVCRFSRRGTINRLPSISIRQRVVPKTSPHEIGLLDNLLQAANETVHWTQPVFRIIRAILERGERDGRIVYYYPYLFTRPRGA
jgi:hypothetical protein